MPAKKEKLKAGPSAPGGERKLAAAPHLGDDAWRDLLESAPDAILAVDRDGIVQVANRQAQSLFAVDGRDLVGRPLESLVPAAREEAHRAHRARYARSPRTRKMGTGLEVMGLRSDGSEFPVEVALAPLDTSAGPLTVAIARDVTDRRRSERALRLSEQRFRDLVEGTDDLVVGVDPHGRFIYANQVAKRLLGIDSSALAGRTVFDFIGAGDRRRAERLVAAILEEGRASATIETGVVAQKEALDIHWMLNPRYDDAGAPTSITAIGRDVTDRKRLRETRRELEDERAQADLRREVLRRATAAQERERRRIARELHDETGQVLTGAILALGQVTDATSLDSAHRRAQAVKETLVDAVRGVRSLALRLRPSTLDDLGLGPALERLVEDAPAPPGCSVRLEHVDPGRRLRPEAGSVVYRVVQEALTNAARHSQAKHIGVHVFDRGGSLIAIVEDDGRGFAQEKARDGLGLAGMRERAALVGGRVTIDSHPGSGTVMTLNMPLTEITVDDTVDDRRADE